MTNINYLFKYIKNKIKNFDEDEFLFQFQSHPESGSLIAIKDTLTFMNIENKIYNVPYDSIDKLPCEFVAALEIDGFKDLFHVKKSKNNHYSIKSDNKAYKLTNVQLEKHWKEIVLIVIPNKLDDSSLKVKSLGFNFFFLITLPFVSLYFIKANVYDYIWLFFSMCGIFLSLITFKELIGFKSNIVDEFCNLNEKVDCKKVTESNKWKLFQILPFNDISLIYFIGQFLSFYLFSVMNNIETYYSVQKTFFYGTFLFVSLSIYYQSAIVKAWCTICITIIILLLSQFIILNLMSHNHENIIPTTLLIIYLVFIVVISIFWDYLKKLLSNSMQFKEQAILSNRLLRNYLVFKNTLTNNTNSVTFPHNTIVSNPKIIDKRLTVVTNPFCKYCSEAHKIFEKITDNNRNHISIEIIFNITIDSLNEDDERLMLYRSLINIYLDKGYEEFNIALTDWFNTQNIKDWLKNYKLLKSNNNEADKTLRIQNKWCEKNGYTLTPTIFVQHYPYPKIYPRDVLPYFIPDIISDNEWEFTINKN